MALIVTGTIGSIGAVLSITPPQFGNQTAMADASASNNSGNQSASSSQTTTQSQTQNQATNNNQSQSKKPTQQQSQSTQSTQSTQSNSANSAPTPAQPQAQENTQSSAVSGTFTGNPFEASERGRSWGTVTVKVTFKEGIISAISGNQSPASRGPFAINQLDPYVADQKISIESIKSKSAEALPYVSGVSYTSMAYWNSLKSAIKKAGL